MSYGPTFAAAVDVTGGTLDLPVGARGIENLRLVDLVDSGVVLAEALDLPVTGGFRRGSCWGLLAPSGHRWVVVLMGTTPADLSGDGVEIGRLSDDDAHRWASRLAGRPLRVAIVIEGTPGFDRVDVRFRSDLLARPLVPAPAAADLTPTVPASPPPPVAPAPDHSSTLPPAPAAPPVPPAPVTPAPVVASAFLPPPAAPSVTPPPGAPAPLEPPPVAPASDAPVPAAEVPQSPDVAVSWAPPVAPEPVDAQDEPVAARDETDGPWVAPEPLAAQGSPAVGATPDMAGQPETEMVDREAAPTAQHVPPPLEEPEPRDEPLVATPDDGGTGAEPEAWAPPVATRPEIDAPPPVPADDVDHAAETPWSIDVRDRAVAPWTEVAEQPIGDEVAVDADEVVEPTGVTEPEPAGAPGEVVSADEPVAVPEPVVEPEPEPEPVRARVTEADLAQVPAPPPPPGWYPDPGDARFWRRWDGTQWTDESSVEPPGLAAS